MREGKMRKGLYLVSAILLILILSIVPLACSQSTPTTQAPTQTQTQAPQPTAASQSTTPAKPTSTQASANTIEFKYASNGTDAKLAPVDAWVLMADELNKQTQGRIK